MPTKRFDLALSEPPKPLPDDDAPVEVAEASAPSQPSRRRPSAARTNGPASRIAEPKPTQTKAVPAEQAGETVTYRRAATTVRLRPSAADPLNAAWLDERRRTDPTLSYPEFASKIVRLGLAEYEKQQAR